MQGNKIECQLQGKIEGTETRFETKKKPGQNNLWTQACGEVRKLDKWAWLNTKAIFESK